MSDLPTMHIDGAARGNPGPAAYAVVIARPGLPPVEEAATLGSATNNVAEYTALVRGLERAADLGLKRLAVFSDSELLVKQMNGEYRVKHPDLLPLYQDAKELVKEFDAVTITHVRRGQNARADALCNQALDGKLGKGKEGTEASSPPSLSGKGAGGLGHPISDAAVRGDAVAILWSAAQAWASRGLGAVPAEAVWEQLWSVLEEGGVLKKKK
jgi:ribonuclease HI